VGRALPQHYADQETLLAAFRKLWEKKHFNLDRLEQLHRHVRVTGRHLALPMQEYEGLDSFQKTNDAWIRVALEVGEQALVNALEAAGLKPRDLDALLFVSVTGIATPSIDARLINRMQLRSDPSAPRSSAWAAWRAPQGLPAPQTTSAPSPTRWPRCSRWSCAP
jgi:alkylresorcinol/alkylpyrone synthase